jgi:ribonuclease HII
VPDFSFEAAMDGPVAGIDEAGRGPWAGPVVAAAVVFPSRSAPEGIADSKTLRPETRERLFDRIIETAIVGIGAASSAEIDRLNVLAATMLAMQRAVGALTPAPAFALVDGNRTPDLEIPVTAVVRGDGRSVSIAAASIIAKVTRDRIMRKLAAIHPGYGWERNAGYGTAEHEAALRRLGPTPHHRNSFAPVRRLWKTPITP